MIVIRYFVNNVIRMFVNHMSANIKPLKFVEMRDPPTLFFFDFETKTEENKDMTPFYCIVQKVCRKCDKIPFEKTCDIFLPDPFNEFCDMSIEKVECCGFQQFVFEYVNDSVVNDLVNFIMKQSKCVWIAHNGGRFDSIFILRHLLVERKIIPELVLNGNQLLSIDILDHDIMIIDTYSFLNMPLRNFPKALGIENVEKGYHPYKFTDLTYCGSMISKEYFDEKVRY